MKNIRLRLRDGGMAIILFAFILSACGNADLDAEREDGAIQLTHNAPISSQNPVFSPDGDYILYTRFLDGYNLGESELVKMRIEDGIEQIIVPAGEFNNVNVPFGSWVDDKICFSSDRGEDADEIWVVDDDGSNLRQLTFHGEENGVYFIEPVFNPQNTNWILFEYVTGENDATAIHQIALLDAESGEVSLLTDGSFDDRLPSWRADGEKMLFQRNEYGQDEGWEIYVADIDIESEEILSNIESISNGISDDTDCSWSYDNESMLTSSNYGGLETPNIYRFFLDPTLAPVQITFNAQNEDGAASESPNGAWIAFESHFGEDEDIPSEIWMIRVGE